MSNLLKDASILLTPTAYENGRMNAIKPYKDLYGPELVTNGDFATDSNWTKGTGWSIGNGKASRTSQSGSTACDQNISITANKTYKIVYDLTITSGSFFVRLAGTTNVSGTSRTTSGTYTDYLTAAPGNNKVRLVGEDGSFVGSIDNVSVVEDLSGDFQFSRNSAATRVNAQGLVENVQIISDELVSNGNFSQIGTEEVSNGNFSQEGSELVTNGDFSNGTTDWTPNASATLSIDTGRLKIAISGEASGYAKQDIFTIESGKQYKCTGTVDFGTASQMRFYVSNTGQFFDITQSGNFNFTFTSTGTSTQIRLYTYGDGNYGFWDNISVKEVGQDWVLGGSGSNKATIGSNSATITSVDGNSYLQQNSVLTSGKSYKISYEILSSSGSSVLKMISSLGLATVPTTVGTHTVYGTATTTTFYIERASNGINATITNISVKEVGQDWNLIGTATITENQANIVTTSAVTGISQTNILTVGKNYKLSYNIVSNNNGGLKISGNEIPSIVGDNTYYFTASVAALEILRNSGVTDITITNISVKEVGQDWVFSSQSEIIEDAAKVVSTDGSFQYVQQSNFLTIGKTYKLTLNVLDVSAGSLKIGSSGGGFDIANNFNTLGVSTFYFTANGDDLSFSRVGVTDVTITNISVKEVGQDWTVADDDANNYVEFNQQEGTVRLKFLNTSPLTTLTNDTQYLGGKKYKLTVDVKEVVSGAIKIDAAGVSELFNSVGIQERIIEPTSNTYVSFYRATANVDVTLNSVSLKEITDDTDLPRINYEGFSYQDSLGSELIVNGDFATNSEWNGSKTIANGQLTKINTGLVYQSILDVSVKDYKVVVDVDTVGASLTIYLGGTQQSLSSGVNTFDMQSGGSNSFVGFNNGAGSIINSISVKEVVGQEVVPDSGCGSWLLEGQSTNLITYSSDFTQWSFKTGIGVSSNEIISVDGSLNGSKIETTAAGARYVGNNYTLSTGDNTFSVFAKKGVNNWVYLNVIKDGTNNWNYTFDLQNGLIGQSNSSAYSTTAKIEDYGNGWYRCSITANVTSAGVFTARIYCADSATDVSTIVGSNVYIYGAQLENQSYSTSYVPTSGATNTRLQDIANNSGNSTLINSTEGVLYGEISTLAELGTFRQINISKDSSNRIYVSKRANNGKLEFRMENPLGNLNFSFVQDTTTETIKFAFRYGLNNFAVFINGVNKNVTTIGNVFSVGTLNNLEFNSPLNQPFYGNVKALAVFKEALTDEQLQELTTI